MPPVSRYTCVLSRLIVVTTAVVVVALLLAACAGEDTGQQAAEPTSETTRTGGAAVAPAASEEAPTRALPTPAAAPTPTPTAESGASAVGPDGHYPEVRISDDGTKHLIPLDEVRSGGPAKDGIPSIDQPRFAGPDVWDALNYRGDDLVIGVEVNGKRRAYPFQILVWHELVNDTFDGQPLLISYCPLCGTGIVFVPLIDGERVEFGVSGKLYNSDLLMYDRKTDSLWSQITGTAVVGPLTGTRLAYYPSEIMTWDDWRATYPDSEVLTRETGFSRDYDRDPYGGYYTDGSIWFPVADEDDRLHPKTRVTGVEIDAETFGAYPDDQVIEHGPVNDVLGDTPVLVVADPAAGQTIRVFERWVEGRPLTFMWDGDVLVDEETGTRWNAGGEAIAGELAGSRLTEIVPVKGFWFAWYAFHQETELWLPE